jgi:hypothetical protein
MVVEELPGAGAADDDACVTVPGREDGGAAGIKMKGSGVAAAGKRVPDEDDVELATLEAVGGVDYDSGEAAALKLNRDSGALVPVRNADRDPIWFEVDASPAAPLIPNRWVRAEKVLGEFA